MQEQEVECVLALWLNDFTEKGMGEFLQINKGDCRIRVQKAIDNGKKVLIRGKYFDNVLPDTEKKRQFNEKAKKGILRRAKYCRSFEVDFRSKDDAASFMDRCKIPPEYLIEDREWIANEDFTAMMPGPQTWSLRIEPSQHIGVKSNS